jgi:hypothetical protein
MNFYVALAIICIATIGLLTIAPSATITRVGSYGLVILGSLYLFLAPFRSHGRKYPRWVRIALWMVGPMGVSWSGIRFGLLFAGARLSPDTYHFFEFVHNLLGGMFIGILLLVVISGEFINPSSENADAKTNLAN